MSDETVRVFLVGKAEESLRAAIEGAADLDLVDEVETHDPDLDDRLAGARANVAIIRVNGHDEGIALCRRIRSEHENVSCVVLSALDADTALVDAILSGAADYLAEEGAGPDALDRLRRARNGMAVRDWLQRAAQEPSSGDEDPLAKLTYRERSVVRHIVHGLTNRQIGEELGLAEKTVRNYVSNILNKLDLDNRTQLAVHLARTAADERLA